MKLNKEIKSSPVFTHEGGKADKVNAYQALRRSVMATLLWEDGFYESGVKVADRIRELVVNVPAEKVADLAIEARSVFNLRHVPLFLARELARHENSRHVVSNVLETVIQRPDELTEFVAIYWKDGKCPLAGQVKKGLGNAFKKFNEYALAKYNQDGAVKLRDVLFLTHPKPADKAQEKLWKKLVNNELATPDTWEVEISAKGNNKESWERLLSEGKMGALAILKNLRNFKNAAVNESLIVESLLKMDVERVLPFRFISAAKYYPSLENVLEEVMMKSLKNSHRLHGKTAIAIDVSGSMDMHKISAKSELTRTDAAAALAILLREQCEKVDIFTFSKLAVEVPNRRGFALRDAIVNSQEHSSTKINPVIELINKKDYDRVIILTDGQIEDNMAKVNCGSKFMLNVANNQNGIGYKDGWTNIDGFSESVVRYLLELDKESQANNP